MVDTATCHLDAPQGRTSKPQLPQRLSARRLHWSAAESPSLAATPLPVLPAFIQGLTHAGYKGLTASGCYRSTLKATGALGLPGGEGGGEGGLADAVIPAGLRPMLAPASFPSVPQVLLPGVLSRNILHAPLPSQSASQGTHL